MSKLRYGDMQLQRTLMDMPEYMACKRGQDLCSWGQLHPPKGALITYILFYYLKATNPTP